MGGPGGPGGPGDGSFVGGPLTPNQEMPAPVKSGLVNDPLAGIGNPGPQFPGQWGPGPGQWGPQGGMPGPWGGPPGPWGPRPPFPPNMMCISQGNSGKPCKHFSRGQCTYGNRCIHLHLVPANQGMPQQVQANAEGEESEEESDEEEEERENGGHVGNLDKRAEAKRKAFEEAMKAAKAAAAKAGDITLGSGTGGNSGASQSKMPDLSIATTKMGGHMMMHAYSVGQKSKKKDPKPEEQRPGDWQCECGNYNFTWRKKCNACDRNKPFNPVEEESKQKELERIKEERARRRAQQDGKIEPGDLRNIVNRERSKREGFGGRDRERDRGGDSRDRGMGSRDRGPSRDGPGFGGGRRFEQDSGNANMVPLGPGRRGESSSGDKHRERERRESDRDRDSSRSHRD